MSSTTTLPRRLSAKSTKHTTARRSAPVSAGRVREMLEEIAFVLQAARRISREIKGPQGPTCPLAVVAAADDAPRS